MESRIQDRHLAFLLHLLIEGAVLLTAALSNAYKKRRAGKRIRRFAEPFVYQMFSFLYVRTDFIYQFSRSLVVTMEVESSGVSPANQHIDK